MTTIQETINRLRELDQEALPAPWWLGDNEWGHHAILCEYGESVEVVIDTLWEGEPMGDNDPDLQLILEARNSLPDLLAEIGRMGTRLSIAEARLGRVAAHHPEAYLAALEGDKE